MTPAARAVRRGAVAVRRAGPVVIHPGVVGVHRVRVARGPVAAPRSSTARCPTLTPAGSPPLVTPCCAAVLSVAFSPAISCSPKSARSSVRQGQQLLGGRHRGEVGRQDVRRQVEHGPGVVERGDGGVGAGRSGRRGRAARVTGRAGRDVRGDVDRCRVGVDRGRRARGGHGRRLGRRAGGRRGRARSRWRPARRRRDAELDPVAPVEPAVPAVPAVAESLPRSSRARSGRRRSPIAVEPVEPAELAGSPVQSGEDGSRAEPSRARSDGDEPDDLPT